MRLRSAVDQDGFRNGVGKIPNQDGKWPREVVIQPTLETAARELHPNYHEDEDGGEALVYKQGEMRTGLEINSWREIPRGWELVDEDDRAEYGRDRDA